jgi:hypothetical protein
LDEIGDAKKNKLGVNLGVKISFQELQHAKDGHFRFCLQNCQRRNSLDRIAYLEIMVQTKKPCLPYTEVDVPQPCKATRGCPAVLLVVAVSG